MISSFNQTNLAANSPNNTITTTISTTAISIFNLHLTILTTATTTTHLLSMSSPGGTLIPDLEAAPSPSLSVPSAPSPSSSSSSNQDRIISHLRLGLIFTPHHHLHS
ncbi:hypothetical protein H072_7943 [Dactylellina haptotyla CBS 200.50]|uniref:Uncharacterized protein n=1 Tax=Dactylellina haptotyla (strain CBS 200.50) TaxID=1284197 RepID=S8A5T5_DACHA|nr:hypothetical protein H072_7943 [Dactylellina haptotyla CBS 200.50]